MYQYLMGTARLRPGAGYADLSADIAGLERPHHAAAAPWRLVSDKFAVF
jgi:hypothetical protein